LTVDYLPKARGRATDSARQRALPQPKPTLHSMAMQASMAAWRSAQQEHPPAPLMRRQLQEWRRVQ
jgi:hypothetical protein